MRQIVAVVRGSNRRRNFPAADERDRRRGRRGAGPVGVEDGASPRAKLTFKA